MENEGAVTQDVAPAATETETPAPQSDSTAAPTNPAPSDPGAARRGENAIPHWRVEEMRKKDREQLDALRKKIESYEGVLSKVNQGIFGMAKGFGFVEEEKPKFVDEKTYQSQIQSLEQKLSGQFKQELMVRELQSSWKQVERKHEKWAKVRGFKQACLEAFAESPDKDLSDIADEIAGDYAKLFAVQTAQAEAEKAKAAEATKVVKPGGGSGAPAPKGDKGKLSDRVLARLKER